MPSRDKRRRSQRLEQWILTINCKKVPLFFELFRECVYIMHIKHIKLCIMSIIETIIYIVGWSTMIGIFNYLENE